MAFARNKKLARRLCAMLGVEKPKLLEVGSSNGVFIKHISEFGLVAVAFFIYHVFVRKDLR